MAEDADKDALTLERYAEIKAHTLHFPPAAKSEVLARLGVESAAWERADAQWMGAIKAESRKKEAPTSRAFAMAFAETQKRLEEENPLLETLGELPAPEPPAPAATPADLVPEGMRHFQSLHGTELASAAPAGPALPFDAKAASPAKALDNAIAHAREVQHPAPAAKSKLGETSYALSTPAGPALPFGNQKPPADSDVPGFSLEQYASLTVELELRPAQTDETLRRYGLSAAQRSKLDAYWQKRMSESSSVWLDWDRARNAYRAWLLRQPAWQRGGG